MLTTWWPTGIAIAAAGPACVTPEPTEPFDRIDDADFAPAIDRALEQARAEIARIADNPEPPTFANTIEAIIHGANLVDATMGGLGRGAGNCPLELLVGFLKNPKFNLRPLLEVIGKYILPLQDEMDWGYHMPYMITGILNMHPDASLEFMNKIRNESAAPDFASFYDQCMELQQ